jgi:hypothetical protein
MTRFLLSCVLLLAFVTNGQQILPLQQDTSLLKHQIILSGDGFYLSNTLQNDFTQKLLLGGYITDDIKNNSMKGMVSRNRLGSNVSAEFDYQNFNVNLFGNKKWGMVIRAGYEMFNAVQFSREAFQLGFQGNTQLEYNRANFGNMHINSIAYQKIGFGVIDKKSKSSVVLNFVNGSSFYKGQIDQGDFAQSPNYDTIGLKVKGQLNYNSNKKNFFNGQGFAFDADFRIKINWHKGKTAYIQVMAKNIGLVFFNSHTTQYNVDTSYRYTGFKFKQLLSEQPLVSKDFSLLDTLNIHQKSTSKAIWLPGYIQVGKIVDRNNPAHWQPFFGINVYTSIICLPQIYAGVHYQPAKWFAAGAQMSYGGFGLLRGGLYLDFRMKDFAIGIATNDIYGLCSQRGFGASAQFRLTWQIK